MINQIINILFPVFALVGVGYLVGRYIKPDFRPINRINIASFGGNCRGFNSRTTHDPGMSMDVTLV